MRKRNFIQQWRPVMVFVGMVSVALTVMLIAWLCRDGDPQLDTAGSRPSATTQGTVQSEYPFDGETEQDASELTEPSTIDPTATQPTDTSPTTPQEPSAPQNDRLSCDKIAIFSGKFVEDGSDVPVENVAALLVTNRSDQFLDMATIQYEMDGKKATFIVSGLAAGESCWVMEYTAMSVTADVEMRYVGCTTSFRDGVTAAAEEITVKADGNMLLATNNTDRTLKDVFIYYKLLHEDGNYFGGITYMVKFGDLEPGQSVEKLGGHYAQDETKIVRIGWQESQSDQIS